MALTSTAGRVIADAVVDGDETWRLFESFGLPMAGGKWGRIPAQLIYWRHGLAARFFRKPGH
jgi:gamma-glutamylputrescine oxidase